MSESVALAVVVPRPSEMERVLAPYVGREIASGPLTEFLTYGGGAFQELRNPSRILQEHSEWGWRPGELYERMFDDAEVAGLWQKRPTAVLALPRYVRAANSSPLAQATADFVRQSLALIPSRHVNMSHTLGSIPRGMSIHELMWERISRGPLARSWVVVDQLDRPNWRFTFSARDQQLFVRQRGGLPIAAPPLKFQIATYGTKDHPFGIPLWDKVFWFWLLKKHAAKYWAVYVEKFAMPLVDATYQHRTGSSDADLRFNQEQQELLLRIIQEIQTGSGIVHPEGTLLKFMEASRGGDSTYASFISWLARGMALLILGEVDTSGLAKGPGSFAKSQVSNDVRLETVAHDAQYLGGIETDTLARWLVHVNFGPDAPVPKIVYDSLDVTDRAVRSAGIESALKNGVAVPMWHARSTWQIPEGTEGEEFLEPPTSKAEPPPPAAPPEPPPAANDPQEDDDEADDLSAFWLDRVTFAAEDLADLGASVEALDADLAAVVDDYQTEMVEYFTARQEQLVGLWEDVPAEMFARLRFDRAPLMAESLQTAQIHGAGLGLLALSAGVSAAAGAGSVRLTIPPEAASARTPATAAEIWARILSIPKAFFLELIDAMRKVSFTVAGLTEATALVETNELVGRALAEGMDRATFVREMDSLYGRLGLTPTSPHHAALVYANNVRQAAADARYRQTVGNPAAHRLLPYLIWWTLDDSKVRDGRKPQQNHSVMHGRIFAIGHEIWQVWWPIAGHNCRCGIGTINLAEARRRGLTGAEPTGAWPINPETGDKALPDPGFRGRPNLEFVASQAVERARTLVEAAREREGAGGGHGLLDALRALFTALGLAAEIFGGQQ